MESGSRKGFRYLKSGMFLGNKKALRDSGL
jgi:hypothetical protein